MEIKKLIEELNQELIDLRRDFHKSPELGFEEFLSQEKIYNYLKDLDLEVEKITKTGVVALLKGSSEGKTLMLRADMDALPVLEENDIDYKSSVDGVMHACGHDAHMAMLLVAAKILVKFKNEIKGNIKFVFQPNEEIAGAKYMIEDGVLENPKVDAAIGLHIWSPIETGKIGISPGPVMGAMDIFKIELKGRGGHTALPQEAIDPINVAAQIILASQNIQTKEINVLSPTLISFARIEAGKNSNIIPETLEMEGTLRYLYEGGPNSVEKPRERMHRIVKGVSDIYGVESKISFETSNVAVINDKDLSKQVEEVANEVVGRKNIVKYVTMAGEDFSEFGKEVPSVFYFIGSGNIDKKQTIPHHHPKFNIDEDALKIGVQMHVRTALDYLK